MHNNNPRKIDYIERKRKVLSAMAETLEWFTASDITEMTRMGKDYSAKAIEALLKEEMIACSVVRDRRYYAITRRGLDAIKTETTDE